MKRPCCNLIVGLVALIMVGPLSRCAAQGFRVVNTRQYAAGSLCLSSLSLGVVSKGPSFEQGVWTWEKFRIDVAAPGSGARLTIYDQPVDWDDMGLVDCSKPPAGRKVVLSGAIRRGILYMARAINPNQGARYQIDPRNIDLELGAVTVNPQPLFGGTVGFKDRLVWLYNDQGIEFRTHEESVGKVLMEVTDIALTDAKLRLGPGGEPVKVTLKAQGSNVFFSYGLKDGALALVGGTMWTPPVTLPRTDFAFAGLRSPSAALKAARFELTGGTDQVRALFKQAELSATEVAHGASPAFQAVLSAPMAIYEIAGTIPHSQSVAELGSVHLKGLKTSASSFAVLNEAGEKSFSSAATIALTELSDNTWDGSLALSTITWPGASQVAPDLSLPSLDLRFAGPKGSTTFSGEGTLGRLGIGSFSVQGLGVAARNLVLGPSVQGESVSVPFAVDFSTPGGQLQLDAPGRNQVNVTATVDRLVLRGSVGLSAGMKLESLTVPANGLDLACSVAVATGPLLYGSKPSFANGSLQLRSLTDLTVRPGERRGSLEARIAGLLLPDPELSFDQGRLRVNAPLQTQAAASLAYDIDNGVWQFQEGSLTVSGIRASTLGETPLELDQFQLTKPTLEMARLELRAHGGALSGVGTGLKVSADAVTHGVNPRMSGRLSAPLSLASFEVVADQVGGQLTIKDVVGTTFEIGFTGLEYVSADGFTARGDARVSAARFSRDTVEHLVIDIPQGEVAVSGAANGRANLVGFHLDASGSKNSLGGTAHLGLQDVSLDLRVPAALDGSCQPMDLRASVGLGNLSFEGVVTAGALTGEAAVGNVAVHVREDGHFHCEFDRDHHIKDEWVLFSVPCVVDWQPKMCDVKAGPIDARIHWTIDIRYFEVGATVGNTTVQLRGNQGIKACGGQLSNLTGPFIAGAYVPTFNNDIPFISDVINGFILALGYGVESSLVNGFGTTVTLGNVIHRPELMGGC